MKLMSHPRTADADYLYQLVAYDTNISRFDTENLYVAVVVTASLTRRACG